MEQLDLNAFCAIEMAEKLEGNPIGNPLYLNLIDELMRYDVRVGKDNIRMACIAPECGRMCLIISDDNGRYMQVIPKSKGKCKKQQ